MLRTIPVPAVLLVWATAAAVAAPAAPHFRLSDTNGVVHTSAEWAGKKAVLLFFVTTDCPVANSYVPEMNRIRETYSNRGVAVYAVQADTAAATADVARYAREFRYSFPLLLDPRQAMVALAGATVTPQAAVLSPGGSVLYLGRIDNRVEDFDARRPAATQHDLREALDAVLGAKPVPHPRTKAIGCAINRTRASAAPTFNHDIAPILHQNCAGCHRPGQVAPFSLLTYQEASKRAALIAAVTAKRYMPPWKAEPGYGHFSGERRLTDDQIALLGQWARRGAPEGDPGLKPATPEFPSGWLAGKPDAVLEPAQEFHVPAEGRDVFQCFVIPTKLTADRFVRTVEFHPGNPAVVHHALFFLDTSGRARRLDAATPEPGYPCFGGPRFFISGGLGGWAPGAMPQALPAGVAHSLEKGADVVMQIHYHPWGKPETDRSSVGLTFGDAPAKGLAGMMAGTRTIDLAPGDQHHEISDSIVVPQNVELIGITPHAHWLCKEMQANAHLPDGRVEPLLWIRDWDFNWQGTYRYARPVALPKGTRIEMRYVYDNSADNPRNPSSPPRRVHFGEQTTDEMAFLFLQVVLPRPEDVPAFRRKVLFGRITRAFGR